jgi:hypothetical protein
MLRVATERELQDISKIDLEDLTTRFQKHVGEKYKPETIRTYKGRLETTIRDYLDAHRLLQHESSTATLKAPVRSAYLPQPIFEYKSAYPQAPALAPKANSQEVTATQEIIFPIPLRADLVVYIKGLPRDLTSDEANKISKVIAALAVEKTSET